MLLLAVTLALATLLTLSHGHPLAANITRDSSAYSHAGLCEYIRKHSSGNLGAFIPQCDDKGNFLPQQCWPSTGYCWCVDIISGEEIPNTSTPPGAVPVNCDMEIHCPYGWSRYGKQCFVFIYSPRTWIEAESYCQFEGANLASVHSEPASHFIQALTREYHSFPETWLGGHQLCSSQQQCFWMWTDGSRFNFTNWYYDCKMEKTRCCLKINYGFDRRWNCSACDEALPFVCAKTI